MLHELWPSLTALGPFPLLTLSQPSLDWFGRGCELHRLYLNAQVKAIRDRCSLKAGTAMTLMIPGVKFWFVSVLTYDCLTWKLWLDASHIHMGTCVSMLMFKVSSILHDEDVLLMYANFVCVCYCFLTCIYDKGSFV